MPWIGSRSPTTCGNEKTRSCRIMAPSRIVSLPGDKRTTTCPFGRVNRTSCAILMAHTGWRLCVTRTRWRKKWETASRSCDGTTMPCSNLRKQRFGGTSDPHCLVTFFQSRPSPETTEYLVTFVVASSQYAKVRIALSEDMLHKVDSRYATNIREKSRQTSGAFREFTALPFTKYLESISHVCSDVDAPLVNKLQCC